MIVIVAGLPRSGLSVTMQMLHAGGYPCLGEPPAFEPYNINKIPWHECGAKALKLVDAHRQLPPPGDYSDYKVIRLARDLKQQAKSFNKFLTIMTGLPPIDKAVLAKSFSADYKIIDKWANRHPSFRLNFEYIINYPIEAAILIAGFVDIPLDPQKMADGVIKRTSSCHPQLLELAMCSHDHHRV